MTWSWHNNVLMTPSWRNNRPSRNLVTTNLNCSLPITHQATITFLKRFWHENMRGVVRWPIRLSSKNKKKMETKLMIKKKPQKYLSYRIWSSCMWHIKVYFNVRSASMSYLMLVTWAETGYHHISSHHQVKQKSQN